MATTPTHNKYHVQGHLLKHDAEIHELQQAVKSVAAQKGDPGVRGCDGARGLKGDPGRDGVDGKSGRDAVGIQGATGLQGARGIQGRRGETGPKGDSIVGPKGDSIKGDRGEKGEKGDVCYIGPQEVAAAVAAVRAELLRTRAQLIGRIVQHIADHQGSSGTQAYVRQHFEKLLRDVQNDIAEQEAKAART